jgi:hypothetical protein
MENGTEPMRSCFSGSEYFTRFLVYQIPEQFNPKIYEIFRDLFILNDLPDNPGTQVCAESLNRSHLASRRVRQYLFRINDCRKTGQT